MTSILQADDKYLIMYRQYKELLQANAREQKEEIHERTLMQVASQLTVAHTLDHLICLLKKDVPLGYLTRTGEA